MPNWIEGTFRARGSKENVTKFIMEGLQPVLTFLGNEKIKRKIELDDDCYIEISFELDKQDENSKKKHPDELYIPHTKRSFIQLEYGCISVHKCEKSNDFVFATNYKSAWVIDTEAIASVAKEFQIDIRVNGYEKGMEFEQLVEVNRRGVTKCDSFIQYEDYTWQCPMPLFGG